MFNIQILKIMYKLVIYGGTIESCHKDNKFDVLHMRGVQFYTADDWSYYNIFDCVSEVRRPV